MMARYELLEHTADTGFRVRAESLPELFGAAAGALAEIVLDPVRAQPQQTVEVAAGGSDIEETLVNFLNEVLFLLDGRGLAPARIVVMEAGPRAARGVFLGEPRNDNRHPPRLVVKAVTYHQLSVREQAGEWVAEVFLDI
jgi:SHS2 domain-containing protein